MEEMYHVKASPSAWFETRGEAEKYVCDHEPKGVVTEELGFAEAKLKAWELTVARCNEEVRVGLWTFRLCRVFASRDAATYGVPLGENPVGNMVWYEPGRDYGGWWRKAANNMVAVFGSFDGGDYKTF